jgi:hypothetical protein
VATATPIAVTRLMTETVIEATSTMVDVLKNLRQYVLVSKIVVILSKHFRLPVDVLRAFTKGSCSAAFRLMRGACAARTNASQPQNRWRQRRTTEEITIFLMLVSWCLRIGPY